MKTSLVLVAIAMLGPGLMFAQQPGTAAASSSTQFDITPPAPCAVADMHVRQGSSLQMLRSADGNSQPIMTPSITLKPKNGRPLIAATLTVHGIPAGSGTLPLIADRVDKNHPPQPQNFATTVRVNLKPTGDGSYSAELMLSGFGVVNSVDLKSVTYADGTTWKAPAKPECSVKPDPLLLISAR